MSTAVTSTSPDSTTAAGFLAGGGEMGALMRAHDWSASPLGDPSTWPQSLRSVVQLMLNNRQLMFVAWGPELAFLYNDGYAPTFGAKHPWALGRPFKEVWSEIWGDIEPLVSAALAGETTYNENLHLVMERNGCPEDAWFTFSYSPLRDESGEVAGMFCAGIETTAQVLAERRSTAERERLFEMTRDLFGVATFDGYLRSINPAWSRVLGRTDEYLLATPFAEIIHPDDLATTADVVAALRSGEPVHQFHVRLLKADGRPVSFAWSAVPDATAGSGIFYTVGRDITEDEGRSAELAAAQEALAQSQKMETIGQLTGGVAHDFNNLLTPIVSSLDLIRRKYPGDDRTQRMTSGALQSAERAKTLISRLLAFARRQTLDPVPTDIGALVDGMRELVDRSIGPTIKVDIDLAPGLPAAKTDPNQLELAILNLAVNARDAMPTGGRLTVAVAAERVDGAHPAGLAAGDYVRLSVADTGVGMDAGTAKRAIEPFYTTKGTGKGTGLGLSMVHGLTAQLGGGMAIESAPGRGTRVDLWLPATDGAAAASDAAEAEHAKPARSATLLLVDDEELVRMTTADLLRDGGYEVVEAASGSQARELVRGGLVPDVLVTDQLMPGMKGTELAAELRRAMPDLPVLVITGYANLPGIDHPRLAKPFRAAELIEGVRSLVEDEDNVVRLPRRAKPRAVEEG